MGGTNAIATVSRKPISIRLIAHRLYGSVLGGLLAASLLLSGCGDKSTAAPAAVVTTPAANISGNWQVSTVATSGPALGAISGSIDQSGGLTSQGQFTTSVFQLSSACFAQSPNVPLQGFVENTTVTLNSFAVNQQYVVLIATLSDAGAALTGQYNVFGGCGEGSAGSFTGVLYAPFTGSYSGSFGIEGTTARAISIQSTQNPDGNGSGGFTVAGTATFTGFSCFSTGTVSSTADATISGSSISLLFQTNDVAGGQILLKGTLDSTAQQISGAVYTIQGGACEGQTGLGSLTKM